VIDTCIGDERRGSDEGRKAYGAVAALVEMARRLSVVESGQGKDGSTGLFRAGGSRRQGL